MLILKYFATVGTVLTAALLALSAHLAPSEPTAPARALRATTTSSLLIVTPKAPAREIVEPDVAQPKIAAAPPTQPTRHRNRAR
jgi:hypothetical protein